ncbi:unnamed protein product [Didymodactylos carnosus]|uniref:Polo kinase n=2 Tax=Didymodactylos carnosus TaxID=1234261 RepID=A0A814FCS0_9BILA|nr:unnamed protein product [Didymodactylos carnosus]CAF3753661.1 unnamed protein product [Didymodactylos carnosus]
MNCLPKIDYKVFEELGKGGFATVYKATRKIDNLEVACKMIDRKKIQKTSLQHRMQTRGTMHERLKSEIEIHSRLKHPHIVDLLNYFEDENYVYLILELCHKGDLEKYLKSKKVLSENETRIYIKQVIEGLQYLHGHGILHRDIKLQNLLLTENHDIKIADFGLAKKVETRDEKNHTMCGTPNFLSPEIAMRSAHSFETDVWSLGILISTLLTGRPPFDTENILSTLSRVAKVDYELPSSLSEEAQDLINNILQKQPENRLTLAQVKEHPFFSKEYSRHSSTYERSYEKLFLTMGPDASVDSGLGASSVRSGYSRPSILSQNPPSTYDKTYPANLYTANPMSPSSSQQPSYFNRSKTPHDLLDNVYPATSTPVVHSSSNIMYQNSTTPSQPIKARRSPSLDIRRNGSEWTATNNNNTNDTNRPDSASSSLVSRDSGLPRSDLKSSRDYSAKSSGAESSKYSSSYRNGLASPSLSSVSGAQSIRSTRSNAASNEQQQQTSMTTEGMRPPAANLDDSCEHHNIHEVLQQLNTQRLRPLRQATRSVIMSILENGEVVLESTRTKGTKKRIIDVFRISTDGNKIISYVPNSRHGSPIGDYPPPLPKDKGAYLEYEFDNLPSAYWKKYQYALKFVNLVRSRTHKVVLHTPEAKCVLMETAVDFEVNFVCGVKIMIYRDGFKLDDPLKIKLSNGVDGSTTILDYERAITPNLSGTGHFAPELQKMLENSFKYYKYCLSKDRLLEDDQHLFPYIQTFPVIFGKRSTSACSIGRSLSQQFGSSSTVNELGLPLTSSNGGGAGGGGSNTSPTSTLYTSGHALPIRRTFASDSDIRRSQNTNNSTSATSSNQILNNNIPSSSTSSLIQNIPSSSTRATHAVLYQPQYSTTSTTDQQIAIKPHTYRAIPMQQHQQYSVTQLPPSSSSSSLSRLGNSNSNTNFPSTTSLNSTASGSTTTAPATTPFKKNVHGVGSICQQHNGDVEIQFIDGSLMRLTVNLDEEQIYTDSNGKRYYFDRFGQREIPDVVKQKLFLIQKYKLFDSLTLNNNNNNNNQK